MYKSNNQECADVINSIARAVFNKSKEFYLVNGGCGSPVITIYVGRYEYSALITLDLHRMPVDSREENSFQGHKVVAVTEDRYLKVYLENGGQIKSN